MIALRDDQIDFILADIRARNIRSETLQQSLLDHICSILENTLEKEEDFASAYQSVIKTFYQHELREIEEQITFLQQYRNHRVLSRHSFFVLLFAVFIGPFFAYDLLWLFQHYPLTGWHIPMEVWGASLVFSLFPMGILLVLLLTPERLDPLIPRHSFVLLGFHPLIMVIPCDVQKNDVAWPNLLLHDTTTTSDPLAEN